MTYEQKPGTGWEEGPSPLEGVRRWRTPIGAELHLSVSFEKEYAVIARVAYGDSPQHEVPMSSPVSGSTWANQKRSALPCISATASATAASASGTLMVSRPPALSSPICSAEGSTEPMAPYSSSN